MATYSAIGVPRIGNNVFVGQPKKIYGTNMAKPNSQAYTVISFCRSYTIPGCNEVGGGETGISIPNVGWQWPLR